MKNGLKNPYILGALVLIIIFGAWWLISSRATDTSSEKASQEEMSQESQNVVQSAAGEIRVSGQPAGRAVVVDQVVLPEMGWVVVHEVVGGELGNALGAARREAGQHRGVIVELLRSTEPDTSYFVVLYGDNGNKTFELKEDPLVVDTAGDVVRASFTARTPVSPAGN